MPSFPSFAPRNSFLSSQQRLRIGFILSMVMIGFMLTAPIAAQENQAGNPVDGFPVVLNDQTLFNIQQGLPGIVSAQERAKVITARLSALAEDAAIPVETIVTDEQENETLVKAGETILFTIRDSDLAANQSRQEMAKIAVERIQAAVTQYREERSFQRFVSGVVLAVLSTIAVLIFLKTLQSWVSKLLLRIKAARRADRLDIRVQSFQLMNSNVTSYLLTGLVKLLRLVLILSSLYLYIPFVLSQFPATKPIGNRVLQDIVYRANQLAATFAHYLPNLAIIGLIALIAYYAIGLASLDYS